MVERSQNVSAGYGNMSQYRYNNNTMSRILLTSQPYSVQVLYFSPTQWFQIYWQLFKAFRDTFKVIPNTWIYNGGGGGEIISYAKYKPLFVLPTT